MTFSKKIYFVNLPYQFLSCFIYKLLTYDVSADFGILFGMWNRLVMSNPCAKCYHDMTTNNGIHCIFHACLFCVFWTNDRGLSKKTLLTIIIIIYDVLGFMNFSHLS